MNLVVSQHVADRIVGNAPGIFFGRDVLRES